MGAFCLKGSSDTAFVRRGNPQFFMEKLLHTNI